MATEAKDGRAGDKRLARRMTSGVRTGGGVIAAGGSQTATLPTTR